MNTKERLAADPTLATTSGKIDPDYDGPAAGPIDPATAQHTAYFVLSAEERAKGFVRPVRQKYRHVGRLTSRFPLRDLDEDEKVRFAPYSYVKYEAYPESESPITGRYWTQKEPVGKGCGAVTHMGLSLSETYARDPGYYSGTFCVGCRAHFPVGKDGEFVWDGTSERVGT